MTTNKYNKPMALIVDDEPDFLEELGRVFEDLEFDVRTAIDYRDAVRHIEAKAPDFVCINLNLPRDSGYDVCEFVRSFPACPGTPIVVMSDRCSPEDIAFAEEAGADAFLPRPVSMDDVRMTVLKALEDRGLRAPMSRPVESAPGSA